jgi:hypothetical protein
MVSFVFIELIYGLFNNLSLAQISLHIIEWHVD